MTSNIKASLWAALGILSLFGSVVSTITLLQPETLAILDQLPGSLDVRAFISVLLLNVLIAVAPFMAMKNEMDESSTKAKPVEMSEYDKLVTEIHSLLVVVAVYGDIVSDTTGSGNADRDALEAQIIAAAKQANLDTLALLEQRPQKSVLESIRDDLNNLLEQLKLFGQVRSSREYFDTQAGTDVAILIRVAAAADGYQASVRDLVTESNLIKAKNVLDDGDRLAARRMPTSAASVDPDTKPRPDTKEE